MSHHYDRIKEEFRKKYGNYDTGQTEDINKAAAKAGVDISGMTNEEAKTAIKEHIENLD
jgi:hypothetical protein